MKRRPIRSILLRKMMNGWRSRSPMELIATSPTSSMPIFKRTSPTAPVDMARSRTAKILSVTCFLLPCERGSDVLDPLSIFDGGADRFEIGAGEEPRRGAQRMPLARIAEGVGGAHRHVLHDARVAEAIDHALGAPVT